MEELCQSEHLQLLDVVRECYAIHTDESHEQFLVRLVSALTRLIPSTHVTYDEMRPKELKSYDVVSTKEMNTPAVFALWATHMNEHPVLAHVARTGDGQALRISDFWSQRKLRNSRLFHGCYRHFEMQDSLCVTISSIRSSIIAVAWHRLERFTDRECLKANLIRPHIAQAWRNARAFSRVQSQMHRLDAGLESAHLGMILCDAEGRVVRISTLARKHLAKYFKTTRNLDRQLPDKLLRWLKQEYAMLTGKHLPSVRLPLEIHSLDGCLIVRMASSYGANLLLLEETISNHALASIEHLPLTRRESETLHWVAQGKTNGEIATILGISTLTVKKHIEHILHKLGVETRTAAAAMALQFPNRNR